MKFRCLILVALLSFLQQVTVFSQSKKIDSLLAVLKSSGDDTGKVNTLNALGRLERSLNDPDSAISFCKRALELSEHLEFKRGEANAYTIIGSSYGYSGNYIEALKNLFSALIIRKETKDKEGEASMYNNIGIIYQKQGNYPEALKMALASLMIHEELKNKSKIAGDYNNIGIIHIIQKDYPKALEDLSMAIRLLRELGDTESLNHPYNNIGSIYYEMGDYPRALQNFLLALYIREKIGDKSLIGESHASVGQAYSLMGNYEEALKHYFIALKITREADDKLGMALVFTDIGTANIFLKKYTTARKYLNDGLSLNKEIGYAEGIRDAYQNLAQLDSATGNFNNAFENYKMYISYRDSIKNEEDTKKLVTTQLQYDFNKREDTLKQKQILTETKLQAQKKQRYFYWGGLGMLAVLSFFVFLNFRNQKKINRLAAESHTRQKAELELQNQRTVLKERLRISSELHDEVGATLSGIAMYSHLTKEQMKTGQITEIERSLNVMQHSSAQMVDKLSDIVWLINPEQDSLQKLITRLEEYARDMAAIKNMQVKISLPERIADIHLPVENRRNIYLFFKEAINNAVKYSNATLLELTIKETEGKLEFSVRDNGKGFDAVMVRRGNGLENMQKRADEIGAKLVLQSKENEGASVSLQCKIT